MDAVRSSNHRIHEAQPAWILERMAVRPVPPAPPGAGRLFRSLFLPSVEPEVCVTVEEVGKRLCVTVVSLGPGGHPYRDRAPERWERRAMIRSCAAGLGDRAEAALHERSAGGLRTWSAYRDGDGAVHELDRRAAPRSRLAEIVHEIACAAFQDETTARLLRGLAKHLSWRGRC